MAEPQSNPPQQPDLSSQPTIAPNLDSELDSALSKAFEAEISKPDVKSEKSEPVKVEEPKATKQSTEKKPDPPKETEAKETVESDPLSDETLSKLSSKGKEGWNALKSNYRNAKKLAEDREQELLKLKKELAEKGNLTQKETQELKSQIEDLSKYRAMVDIQADPEFITQFEQPINKAQESIKTMLLGLNVSEDVVNQIDFTNTKLMDQIIGHVGEHRDKFIAKKLEREIDKLLDLSDKRDQTLEEKRNNYKEYLEQKKKENFSKGAESEGRMLKRLEEVALAKDDKGNPRIPFLNKVDPPENATQAQIEQVSRHNAVVDLMKQKLDSALKIDSPEGKADLAIAAVAAHYLDAQLKSAIAKIKSLEQEIAKISNVSDETEKTKVKAVNRSREQGKELDLDAALASHFNA